jgi:hypothetical protein
VHIGCSTAWIGYDKNRVLDLCLPVANKEDFIQYAKNQYQRPINQQDNNQQEGGKSPANAEMLKAIQVYNLKEDLYPDVEKGCV